MSGFTPREASLLRAAQGLFILNQTSNFPLYYLPPFRGRLGADAVGKFPCSISWMTRNGLARWSTLVLWLTGWAIMLAALFKEGDFAALSRSECLRAIFMLQMFVTGFICVVLTPMKGPDVANGPLDSLHCLTATIYVVDHAIALEYVLGVGLFTSVYGVAFAVTATLCGAFQNLRSNDDHYARLLYVKFFGSRLLSFQTYIYILEVGFMVTENALFFIFLFGMTSGIS